MSVGANRKQVSALAWDPAQLLGCCWALGQNRAKGGPARGEGSEGREGWGRAQIQASAAPDVGGRAAHLDTATGVSPTKACSPTCPPRPGPDFARLQGCPWGTETLGLLSWASPFPTPRACVSEKGTESGRPLCGERPGFGPGHPLPERSSLTSREGAPPPFPPRFLS